MNPSCNLEEGLKGFLNLGDPPFSGGAKNVALAELLAAGLPRGSSSYTTKEVEVYRPDSEAAKLARVGIPEPGARARSETMWIEVHEVRAEAYGWKFRRSWYYWGCEIADRSAGSVPFQVATELHAQHGQTVRVDGFAGGREPIGNVGSYHVDTPAGLEVLVQVLKREHARREAELEARWKAKFKR